MQIIICIVIIVFKYWRSWQQFRHLDFSSFFPVIFFLFDFHYYCVTAQDSIWHTTSFHYHEGLLLIPRSWHYFQSTLLYSLAILSIEPNLLFKQTPYNRLLITCFIILLEVLSACYYCKLKGKNITQSNVQRESKH